MKPRHILIALIAFAVCLLAVLGWDMLPERHPLVYAQTHEQRVSLGTLYTNEFVCGEGWTMDSVVLNDRIRELHGKTGKTSPFVIDTPGLPSETIHVPAVKFNFSDMGKSTVHYKNDSKKCTVGNHAQRGRRMAMLDADAVVRISVLMHTCGRVSARYAGVHLAGRDNGMDVQFCKAADE